MIITLTISRTPAQLLSAKARWWAVGGLGGDVVAVTLDPAGPIALRDALRLALEAVLEELGPAGVETAQELVDERGEDLALSG